MKYLLPYFCPLYFFFKLRYYSLKAFIFPVTLSSRVVVIISCTFPTRKFDVLAHIPFCVEDFRPTIYYLILACLYLVSIYVWKLLIYPLIQTNYSGYSPYCDTPPQLIQAHVQKTHVLI